MAKESISSKIEAITKDGGKMIWCMEKDSFIFPTANSSIRENGLMMSPMDGEYCTLGMSQITPAFGLVMKAKWKTVRCMVGERFTSSTQPYSKGNSRMVKYLVVDAEFTLTEKWYRKSGGLWVYRHFWMKMRAIWRFNLGWAQVVEISEYTILFINFEIRTSFILWIGYIYWISLFLS